MSIVNAMYTGVSGLATEGDALGIVGDNVANANTVGFKRARAQFEGGEPRWWKSTRSLRPCTGS